MRRVLAIALTSCFVAFGEARAATITWEFEAIVRGTTGLTGSGYPSDVQLFPIGQVLRGSLSFDSAVADIEPATGLGRYPSAVLALDVEYMHDWLNEPYTTGPYFLGSASSSTPSEMAVFSTSGPCCDWVRIDSGIEMQSSSSSIRNFHLALFQQLGGPSLWSTAEMVLTPPPLSALQPFDLASFEAGLDHGLILSSADNLSRVGAELTLLQAVPEPADSVVFGMALLALLGCRCAALSRK